MSQQQNQRTAPVTDAVEDTGMILPPIPSNNDYDNDPKVCLNSLPSPREEAFEVWEVSAPLLTLLAQFWMETNLVDVFVGLGSYSCWCWSCWIGFCVRTGQAWEASPLGGTRLEAAR